MLPFCKFWYPCHGQPLPLLTWKSSWIILWLKIISSHPSILAFKGQALRGNPNHTIHWRSPIPGFRYDFPPKAILRAFSWALAKRPDFAVFSAWQPLGPLLRECPANLRCAQSLCLQNHPRSVPITVVIPLKIWGWIGPLPNAHDTWGPILQVENPSKGEFQRLLNWPNFQKP